MVGIEVLRTGDDRQRIVAAARSEPLGVGSVVHVVRIGLELQADLWRKGILGAAAGLRRGVVIDLRSAGDRIEIELHARVTRAEGQLGPIRQLVAALAEPGELLVPSACIEEIRVGRKCRVVANAEIVEDVIVRRRAGTERIAGTDVDGLQELAELRVMDLLEIVLPVDAVENAGRPRELRVVVHGLQAKFLREVLLAVVDGRR